MSANLKRVTAETGHAIAYEDLGAGPGPALLVVPGWCNPRRFMAPLAERLARGRRVLLVDLPGHGDSPAPAGDFTTADVTADLRAVLDDAKVASCVQIGLANGCWFGLELARQAPERIRAMVALTWSLCELPSFFRMALEGLQSPEDWEETRDMFFGMWFQHADPALISWVRDEMAKFGFDMWGRSGREIAASFTAHKSAAQLNSALPSPLPALHLFCRPGLPEEFLAMHRAQVNPNAWYEETIFDEPWAFPSYEAPDALAAQIEPFLARF